MRKKVEVIVSTVEKSNQDALMQKKLQAIDGLNGLISDISKKKLDEFDRVMSDRNPFRSEPIEL
jgi:hypothetical protein